MLGDGVSLDSVIDCGSRSVRNRSWDLAWLLLDRLDLGRALSFRTLAAEESLQPVPPQLDEEGEHARKLIKSGNKMLSEGTISLQAESHPVEYRKVEIRILEK